MAAVPERSAADVAGRARGAQQRWAAHPAAHRAAALGAIADELAGRAAEPAELVIREVGEPRREAVAEVSRSVVLLRSCCQRACDPIGAVHEPVGSGLLAPAGVRWAWPT